MQRHWRDIARQHRYNRRTVRERGQQTKPRRRELDAGIEQQLTARAATFDHSQLRAVALEHTVGALSPEKALRRAQRMLDNGRILQLTGGILTTRALRANERTVELRLERLGATRAPSPRERDLRHAADRVAERIGAPLSTDQLQALRVIAGPTRTAVLLGPAGTGKGVARTPRARQPRPRRTHPHTRRLNQPRRNRPNVGERTTVYLDEAGMADTSRLSVLAGLIDRAGAKLILVGDPEQLPSISAGGM